jgi:GT2 family glycosyltransferase
MYSIVILSRNPVNASRCVMALYQNEPELDRSRIVIVDDGAREKAEVNTPGVTWLDGEKPFCFSRNANIGVRHAFDQQSADAVILLNDDAMLVTKRGFRHLWLQAQTHENYGLLAAATNEVGNPNQMSRGANIIRREERMLCFVCVIIRRDVWEKVGELDERFSGYGHEDDDYSLRVRNAGYRLGVLDECFVDHSKLKSTYRGDKYPSEGFAHNRQLFEEKYA